ncbi:hypothetical protein B14911_11177 [Bacillus sp. NRRL B-14911]|nr:hypothetical protein B14911_11177 [Bacillus sp. NRRL B-14911]
MNDQKSEAALVLAAGPLPIFQPEGQPVRKAAYLYCLFIL